MTTVAVAAWQSWFFDAVVLHYLWWMLHHSDAFGVVGHVLRVVLLNVFVDGQEHVVFGVLVLVCAPGQVKGPISDAHLAQTVRVLANVFVAILASLERVPGH